MTIKLTTIEEKQAYYRFDTRPWRMKDAPTLSPVLAQAMSALGLDSRFRFVWGGVVLVREEENSEVFTVARGGLDATHVINDVVLPKYAFARAKQARGYYYIDSLNRRVSGFTREEMVPREYMARVDYRYLDFGRLRWYLEELATAEVLVDARVYAPDEVPAQEWGYRMVLQSTKGDYYEPGLEMIPVLQKRVWENQNADLTQIAADMMQRTAKARLDAEAAEAAAADKEYDEVHGDVLRDYEKGTVYNIPFHQPTFDFLNILKGASK